MGIFSQGYKPGFIAPFASTLLSSVPLRPLGIIRYKSSAHACPLSAFAEAVSCCVAFLRMQCTNLMHVIASLLSVSGLSYLTTSGLTLGRFPMA